MAHLPTVIAAAIEQDGEVYALPAPARHHDVIRYMAKECDVAPPIRGKQGFLLSDGRFVDRVIAKAHAAANKQLKPGAPGHRELFSEDVW